LVKLEPDGDVIVKKNVLKGSALFAALATPLVTFAQTDGTSTNPLGDLLGNFTSGGAIGIVIGLVVLWFLFRWFFSGD
jgi:hypothetical protein